MAYAHSPAGPGGPWHDLVAHLRGTSDRAAEFAKPFGAAEAARLVGLYHDLGKFHPAFQRYLEDSTRDPSRRGHGPDHKAAGSLLTRQHFGPLAFLIKGHHGGLDSRVGFETWLEDRQQSKDVEESLELARREIAEVRTPPRIELPDFIRSDARAAEFFLRMLFSTLVDADFLDTETHFNSDNAEARGSDVDLPTLLERFEEGRRRAIAEHEARITEVSEYEAAVARAREAIYEDCLRAAEAEPGLFKLTVPTGGGKTLSGMAFALRHAVRRDLRQVIVAVPFITITEQTAGVYREAFRDEQSDTPAVLEHHSAADADTDAEDEDVWRRLASENWDAPVVVTTTVQLFESLFSNKPSRTRKLHRLAKSVIILDEAQALPPHLLTSTLDALQELVRHYGATVVLSTATQPAFDVIPTFRELPATEIVEEPARWFELLRRVRYEFLEQPITWPEVVEQMRAEPQALTVVNTKKDAFALLDALDDDGAFHLSTTLCGAHRRKVIADIRQRLKDGQPCRVVSTQVVEAGVDLDFPLVLRAAGPLDSVIQAAGRCNREGRLGAEGGRVVVFNPVEGGMPRGVYKTAYQVGQVTLMKLAEERSKPDRPEAMRDYFQRLLSIVETDRNRVQSSRERLDYPSVAEKYQMLDKSESVVVTRYGSEEEQEQVRRWIADLRSKDPDKQRQRRYYLRRLQPYMVSVSTYEVERLRRFMDEILPGLSEWRGQYHERRGLSDAGFDLTTFVVADP
jgi:CRISPR-associated endonuclease/helicase Cas3